MPITQGTQRKFVGDWLACAGTVGILLYCHPLFAQVTPTPAADAKTAIPAPMGPLILTPSQRRVLEQARLNASKPVADQPLSTDRSLDASGLPDTLVVSGSVVRSGNRSTVWVNDQPLYGRADANPLRTLAGQAGVLQPGATGMQVKARPGQVIDVPSGQVVDLLPPGSIRIIPPKAGGHKKEE
jgi:hypothetical protein